MRYVYYVGYEQLRNDGGRFNSLHVTDLIRSTKASYTLPKCLSRLCMLYEIGHGRALVGAGDDKNITIFQARLDHNQKALVLGKELISIKSNSDDTGTWSWNSTRSETGMILMELNQRTRRLRVFYIQENGKTSCSEIGDYQTLGFAPYTQPWENGALLSAFERLPTPNGRMAYTGRVIDVDVQSRKVRRALIGKLYPTQRLSVYHRRRSRALTDTDRTALNEADLSQRSSLHLKGKLVTIWTIHRGRWEYVTKLKANFRDITMDVSSNDTAIILVKSSTESESSMTICISSVMLLRLRNVPRLTTIALLRLLDSPHSPVLDEHLCRILERSGWT
ncbi:hypothetical protein Q1695_016273 [Nippostrongylus brasiliensis]|nr:hypothetical protein Q1695_016273 [Nippostrongylus brasiliensis]